jgi:hypothetical protein
MFAIFARNKNALPDLVRNLHFTSGLPWGLSISRLTNLEAGR